MSIIKFGAWGSVSPDAEGLKPHERGQIIRGLRKELRSYGPYELHMGGHTGAPTYRLFRVVGEPVCLIAISGMLGSGAGFKLFCRAVDKYLTENEPSYASSHEPV